MGNFGGFVPAFTKIKKKKNFGFHIYSCIYSYFLADIHSVVIQMQMDLNPFLRFSTDFSAFLLVPCTHYFLAICGHLTPDFMYWHINHINAIFEGFDLIQNFCKPISYRGVEAYVRFLQQKPNSKWSGLCARKRNWWWFLSLYFSDDKANVALNV